jgi:Glycosyl transferase family 2
MTRLKLSINKPHVFEHWLDFGNVTTSDDGGILVLRKKPDLSLGTEMGLVSKNRHSNVCLSFEVNIKNDTCFIAKILQIDQFDQRTNSYHLMYQPNDCYIARHDHIFARLHLSRNSWEKFDLVYEAGDLSVFNNDELLLKIFDGKLRRGYGFLGIRGGEAHLKNINLVAPAHPHSSGVNNDKEYEILHDFATPFLPVVSIITTVYDRVQCLKDCIKSVRHSTFHDYEHIIVSDAPPPEVTAGIRELIRSDDEGLGRICYANLTRRHNNWGIAPASVGLGLARGDYIGFLSDDNGYMPDHIATLVRALETDPDLGFVYSSCLYDGRAILKSPTPRPGQIDLGQPLFRRDMFHRYLNNQLPFNNLAWDWQMIEFFMRRGVRWKHINKPTFVFRLAKYPTVTGV